MLFRLRYQVRGAHTHVHVCSGPSSLGTLVFRNDEWAAVHGTLERFTLYIRDIQLVAETEALPEALPLEHPGRELSRRLQALGMSGRRAARTLGVSTAYFWNVLNGTRPLSPQLAVRLETAFGFEPSVWVVKQALYDLAQINAHFLTT
jgi:addiction module HigA family antidote